MVVKPYPLNPNCSNVHINVGKENYVYFYYTNNNKRKQVKYKTGLNKAGITAKELEKRIKAMYNAVHDLLTNKVYDGKNFNEVYKKQAIPSFNQASDAYLENRGKFISERSITNYELGIEFFKKYLAEIDMPNILLDCIDGELLENYMIYLKSYISTLYKKPLSKFTIKEYKDRLGAVLEFWCSKKRVLSYNPMKSVRLGYELKREQQDNRSVFTIKQLQDIIEYTKKHRKPPYLTLLLLIYYTHLRPMEICRLQIGDINMEARMIYLKAAKSKTRIARKVPLDLPIYNHLLNTGIDFKDESSKEKFVFSYHGNARIGYVGDKMYNHKNMSYGFKKMLDDLGIDRNFNKYHLKHTANVHEIVYEGLSFAEVQAKNGHTLSKTTEVYLRDLKDFYLENRAEEKDRILKFDI
jgi:integrase